MPNVATYQTPALRVEVQLTLPEQLRGRPLTISVTPGLGAAPVSPPPAPHLPQPPPSTRRVVATAARDDSAARGGATQQMLRLMSQGQLLQQSDWRLGQRGLLIPQGGLCATTCAVNALHAAFCAQGQSTAPFVASDALVQSLVQDAWARHHKDARNGIDFGCLANVINDVANELNQDVGVQAERGYTRPNVESLIGAAAAVDTLTLLSVRTGPTTAHAVVLLGVDTRRGVVRYSDPNWPNRLCEARYHCGNRGELVLPDLGQYGAGPGSPGYGEVLDLLSVRARTFDRAPAARFASFAKQRVRITTPDGTRLLTSIERVDTPSPEYPSGRVVHFSFVMGSGGGGTWTFDEIAAIEAVAPPTEREINRLAKLTGERVRLRLTEPALDRLHGGDKVYQVCGVTRQADFEHHPFGGLEVVAEESGQRGVIPFEAIAEATLCDPRLEPARGRASPRR